MATFASMSLNGEETPIQPPIQTSNFVDIFAWDIYHLIHNVGSFSQDKFIFG